MESKSGIEKSGAKKADHMKKIHAVIIADSFATKFRPLSDDTPKCLFPVATVPLIQYVIEMLERNKIIDYTVCVRRNYKQIAKCLKSTEDYRQHKQIHIVNCSSKTSVFEILQ